MEAGPEQIGIVAIGLTALVGLFLGLKRLLEAREQYATKAEVEKLRDYLQSRMHELSNAIAPLPIQVAALVKQYEKIEEKIDQGAARQERVLAYLEHRVEEKHL